jgi:MFS family permease
MKIVQRILYYKNKISGAIKLDKFVTRLIILDVFYNSLWGIIEPYFAVFLTEKIVDGSLRLLGFSATIFFVTRLIAQFPVGYYVDKKRGDLDETYFLLLSAVLNVISTALFVYSTLSWHIYVLQFLRGISYALSYPAWTGLFTRHVKNGKEGMAWTIYSSSIDLGMSIATVIGGYLVMFLNYRNIFMIIGIANFIVVIFAIVLIKSIRKINLNKGI